MNYEIYKILHLAGMSLILVALGSMAFYSKGGGNRKQNSNRKLLAILHGTGMLLLLIAGFGMLAKLGIRGELPTWALAKLGVWIALGVAPTFMDRVWARKIFWILIPLSTILAAALALWKPA